MSVKNFEKISKLKKLKKIGFQKFAKFSKNNSKFNEIQKFKEKSIFSDSLQVSNYGNSQYFSLRHDA